MKKIISFISALVMVFTLMTTISFADQNNGIYFRQETKTANSITYGVYINTDKAIAPVINIDYYQALEVDNVDIDTVQIAEQDKISFRIVKDSQYYALRISSLNDPNGALYTVTGNFKLGTVTYTFNNTSIASCIPDPTYSEYDIKYNGSSVVNDYNLNTIKRTITNPGDIEATDAIYYSETQDLYLDNEIKSFIVGTTQNITITKNGAEGSIVVDRDVLKAAGIEGENGYEIDLTLGVVSDKNLPVGTFTFTQN